MALDFGALQDSTAQQAIEPQLTEATPLEVQGANVAQTLHDLPTVGLLRQQQRYNEAGPETPWGGAVDPRSVGSDADAAAAERGPGPVRSMIQPEDANAQAKAAGVNVTFDKPIPATTVQSVIVDHVTRQQQDAVIARNGNSILSGSAARFAAGSFLSLFDPVNAAAMMIPAAPEAFVAEKLAAASGVFERGLIRGAAGAANGAVGMAALEPLQYAMDKADYNDWSAGDALRRVFMGAAIGAAGHVALGGLFGREHLTPERADDAMTATRGAIAQVMDDRPVDTAVLPQAAELVRRADALETRMPGTPFDATPEPAAPVVLDRPWLEKQGDDHDPALTNEVQAALDRGDSVHLATEDGGKVVEITGAKDGVMQDATGQKWGPEAVATTNDAVRITPREEPAPTPALDHVVRTMDPGTRQQYDAAQAVLADPAAPPAQRAEAEAVRQRALDDAAPAAAADLRAQADTLAKQVAERAMNPAVGPEVARAQTTVKAAIDGAPKITEDVDKNTAEQTKLAAEFHQIIQGEIKAGRLVETAEMRSAMLAADETDRVGKAAADYAACLVGKGGI